MTGAPIDDLRAELRRCLDDEAATIEERLLALIRTIDLADDREHEPVIQEVLARAVIAIAPLLAARWEVARPRIERTARAASEYLEGPSEERWTAFQEASTSSYPFGPGDGCLAVAEVGGHGTPGAGDGGAGFVWAAAATLGPGPVHAALRAELSGEP